MLKLLKHSAAVALVLLAGCKLSLVTLDLRHDRAAPAEQSAPIEPTVTTGEGARDLTPTERAIAEALGATVHGGPTHESSRDR